jgi:hypothetical protein
MVHASMDVGIYNVSIHSCQKFIQENKLLTFSSSSCHICSSSYVKPLT